MNRIIFLLVAAMTTLAATAQQAPNYELAARFSAKKINQMVHSTKVSPKWFLNSDRFWYKWEDSNGTRYYIVDAASGRKSEVFDMDTEGNLMRLLGGERIGTLVRL